LAIMYIEKKRNLLAMEASTPGENFVIHIVYYIWYHFCDQGQ
jgi:hypothetical protein